MSIESVRKFAEKYGVGCFALLFIAFAMTFASVQCGAGKAGGHAAEDESQAIAKVGNYEATSLEVDSISKNQQNSAQNPSPLDQANSYGQALGNVLDHVYGLAFAASKGVTMDDKAVEQAIPSLWAQQVETHRQILVQDHKLAPNASEKDFELAFQKDSGHSLDQERQEFTDNFNQAFDDPAKKELIRSEVVNPSIAATYEAKTNVSDEDLKASYNTISVQRIVFEGKTGSEGDALAQKALADIKGGMSFEDAIKKYNTGKAEPGKSAADTIDLPAQIRQYLPQYSPLFSLKEGEVSGPIEVPNGTSIFKVVKITTKLPPDFDKNKDQLRKDLQKQLASSNLMQDLDNFKKANPPKWSSPAYQAIYDYREATQDYTLTGDKREAKFKQIEDEAKQALTGTDGHVAALAYFAANSALYDSATPDKKKALLQDRIGALTAVLQGTENVGLHLELVDLYLGSGDKEKAADQLKTAAQVLTGTSVEDQKNYETILAKLDKMQSDKKISDADAKSVQGALDRWLTTMHEETAMKAQTEKQEADLKKQNEELMKKQQQDAAAAAAKAKASASAKPSVPSSSTGAKPQAGAPPSSATSTGK